MRQLWDYLREIEWFAVAAVLFMIAAILLAVLAPDAWVLALVLAISSLTATHLIR